MELKTVAERHYKVIMAGVDQFGGNNEAGPVLEAYQMGVKEHGEAFMRKRFEQSAVRLLLNIFRTVRESIPGSSGVRKDCGQFFVYA
jgi:beta-glucosidase